MEGYSPGGCALDFNIYAKILSLSRDFLGGRGHFISPGIGRTYPDPPPEVEVLVRTKQILTYFSQLTMLSRLHNKHRFLLNLGPSYVIYDKQNLLRLVDRPRLFSD
jgi:hypothetical protein